MDFNQADVEADVEGKQVHLLLKGRDDVTLTISKNQPTHKRCKRHGGKHTNNGSRIKKYEEPLTEDILLRLHSARTLKEGQALLKKQAQDEAQARALAIKQKRVLQMMVLETFSMNKDENEVIPPFYLNLQVVTQHGSINTAAFLDSGVLILM